MIVLKTFIVTVFTILFVYSQVLPSFIGWREVFPLFHWSLFSAAEGEYWQYVIVFPEENCEAANCSFLSSEAGSEELSKLVQNIGRSFEGQASDFPDLRNQFEQLIPSRSKKIEYELRVRKSNPAEYVLYGKIQEEKTLATFSKEAI